MEVRAGLFLHFLIYLSIQSFQGRVLMVVDFSVSSLSTANKFVAVIILDAWHER